MRKSLHTWGCRDGFLFSTDSCYCFGWKPPARPVLQQFHTPGWVQGKRTALLCFNTEETPLWRWRYQPGERLLLTPTCPRQHQSTRLLSHSKRKRYNNRPHFLLLPPSGHATHQAELGHRAVHQETSGGCHHLTTWVCKTERSKHLTGKRSESTNTHEVVWVLWVKVCGSTQKGL